MRDIGGVSTKLKGFYSRKGRMPSYAEFAKELGVASKNSVLKWVGKLTEAGVVRQDRTGRLSMGPSMNEVRVLGVVEAGFPGPAEEELADTMSLDEYLIERRESTFMLKVKGDSMKDAGIVEGDLVLVERGASPRAGDIVIAEVDGAWTMKYYQIKSGKIVLVAANSKYKPIIPNNSLKIEAVVRAVIRKYL